MVARFLFLLLLTVPALAQTVSLRSGWNGVAFAAPQVGTLTAPPAVAGLTFWDGTAYPTRAVTPEAVNEGAGTKRGFWVFATGPTNLTYTAAGTTENAVDLRAGWNLVAFPTAVANLTVPPQVLGQFQEIQPDNSYVTVTQVAPGKPYWIFASAAVRLTWSSPSPSPTPTPSPSRFTLVSTGANASLGTQSNGPSFATVQRSSTLSADGRFLVFSSNATNLVAGQLSGVFLYDRTTGHNTRLAPGRDPVISADGQVVAFVTAANLISGDTNGIDDVYVARAGGLLRVSLTGGDSPGISADGGLVTFESESSTVVPNDTNGARDVFLANLGTGVTTRVSVATAGGQANGPSSGSSLSPDGRWVAFASSASNLTPADTNGFADIYIHQVATVTTTRVSQGPGGVDPNQPSRATSVSTDGNLVCFTSAASNLVPDDTNAAEDVFVTNRASGVTIRIPGELGALAADGRYVVYQQNGQIFTYDRVLSLTAAVTGTGLGLCSLPSINADGSSTAFQALANGQQDVFLAR